MPNPDYGEWHWERKGDEHKSPVVWLLVPWLVIGSGLLYLAWHVLRVVT